MPTVYLGGFCSVVPGGLRICFTRSGSGIDLLAETARRPLAMLNRSGARPRSAAPARGQLRIAAHHLVGGGEQTSRILRVPEDESHNEGMPSGLIALQVDGGEDRGRRKAELQGREVNHYLVAFVMPYDRIRGCTRCAGG
jgi:hypothetical protein